MQCGGLKQAFGRRVRTRIQQQPCHDRAGQADGSDKQAVAIARIAMVNICTGLQQGIEEWSRLIFGQAAIKHPVKQGMDRMNLMLGVLSDRRIGECPIRYKARFQSGQASLIKGF